MAMMCNPPITLYLLSSAVPDYRGTCECRLVLKIFQRFSETTVAINGRVNGGVKICIWHCFPVWCGFIPARVSKSSNSL